MTNGYTRLIKGNFEQSRELSMKWINQRAVAQGLGTHPASVGSSVRLGYAGDVYVLGGQENRFEPINIFSLLLCKELTAIHGLTQKEAKRVGEELRARWRTYGSRNGAGTEALRKAVISINKKVVDGRHVLSVGWGSGDFGSTDSVLSVPLQPLYDQTFEIIKEHQET